MSDNTWICPDCTVVRVKFGTKCDDPELCPHPKNINYVKVYSRSTEKSIEEAQVPGLGISEISNENGDM